MLTIDQPQTLRQAPTATLGNLMDVVADNRRSLHDFVTRADQLYVDDRTGCLVARQAGYREFKLRKLATDQLAARIGIPGAYLEKCPTELAAENVNHWLSKQPDRQFLVRCDGDEVRAILSERYSPVDHESLLSWVGETVGRDAQVRYELTEQQLLLQVINRREEGVTDRLNSGVNVRNSEVGLASVEVSGLVYRQICLNGLILSGKHTYKRRHIGDTSLRGEVRRAVYHTMSAASTGVGQFEGTQGVRVPDMDGLFERVASRYNLTKRQGTAIAEAFTVEPGDSLYAGINAITRAGNDITLDLESRRQLQDVGGRILQASSAGKAWLN